MEISWSDLEAPSHTSLVKTHPIISSIGELYAHWDFITPEELL